VFCRGKSHLDRTKGDGLPPAHLIDLAEIQMLDQRTAVLRNDDGLSTRDLAQSARMQVVEVGMCDEYEIARGQVADMEPRLFETFDAHDPIRINGVDEDIVRLCLNQEGSVADPRDSDVFGSELEVAQFVLISMAFGKESREHDFCDEVPFMPFLVRCRTGGVSHVPEYDISK